MTAFVADYIAYVQESRLKSNTLSYKELNQYFWRQLASSHWRGQRDLFYANYENVLHEISASTCEAVWEQHLKNFIARDNLFYYFEEVNSDWIDNNVVNNLTEFDTGLLHRPGPVVFLTVHNFYQALIPVLLAHKFGSVCAFVLDEQVENDPLIRMYLSQMYNNVEKNLCGGSLLKVGAAKAEASRVKLKEALENDGRIYAAIDKVHPTLGESTKVTLSTEFFDMDVLSGVILAGLEASATFVFPSVSTLEDGRLRFEMFELVGRDVEGVLRSFQAVFDKLLSKDVAGWEGASLMTFKEGYFG